jgi:calcineurin-like phosphoesterase family protein
VFSIYIYADPHFGHKKIIEYENRPFTNVEEMDETIIERHNKIIQKHEKVIIAGDFSFYVTEKTKKILNRLNGYKILIIGNHDRQKSYRAWYEYGFNEVYKYPLVYQDNIIISHEPVFFNGNYINIHGHTHSTKNEFTDNWNKHICVSLEKLNYYPIEIEGLLSLRQVKLGEAIPL